MSLAVRAMLIGSVLGSLLGCQVAQESPRGRSPLAQAAAFPDQVTLEVFSAPVPFDDPHWETLWQGADEQAIASDVRVNLAKNGIRAGLVSASMPAALATLLKVTDKPISDEERTHVPLDVQPGVSLRVMQPRQGKRHELVLSPPRPELSLLRMDGGRVSGTTYRQAEGRLALYVFREPAGRVRLELLPELHHGEPRTQTTPSEGMFMWTTQRDKRVFDDLKLNVTLASGEVLLIGALDNAPGSLGHHLLIDRSGAQPARRLWAIRMAQATSDEAFANWSAPAPQGLATAPPSLPRAKR